MERPKILSLNLQPSSSKAITDKGYNLYVGSLGKLVNTLNKEHEFKYCLLNYDYPENIHEYDIVLLDLDFVETIGYNPIENKRTENISGNNTYLLCKYPQTIFDPRPLTSDILLEQVHEIIKRDSIIVAFQSKLIDVKYRVVKENGNRPIDNGSEEKNIYEIIPSVPFLKNKVGKETKVVASNGELAGLLNKYNSEFTYQATFYHPAVWKDNTQVPADYFVPLVINQDGEIVSYIMRAGKGIIIVLPNLEVTSNFFIEFLEVVGPSLMPSIFPESVKGSWKENPEYFLPNHDELLEQKRLLQEEFQQKIEQKDSEINANLSKYKFLHDLLLDTGDNLVSATINFLDWLGFQNVIDMDDQDPETLEEDIQIETEKGLLVIEVKGIGGTSKDTECSQISKIRYRRAEERGKFDVFGLYIVNHQRHLPPNNRENPPFTKEQIRDAINDKRGLLTTYQLFKLYFSIQKSLITKEEAREAIYSYGLVEFKPANLQFIDTITEIFLEGSVFILNLNDNEIKIGDKLYIERNGIFEIIEIKGLQVDDADVQTANSGEVGIKSSSKVKKKSLVYIKNLP